MDRLKNLKPRNQDWVKYQKLIGIIFEYLFVPPLSSSVVESYGSEGHNRRDFIFPNYSNSGFWHYLREKYKADFIVIDAKNYRKRISKKEVLQVSNYLKAYGVGLFGMIFCRNSADKGCLYTRQELWITYNKLILIFDDDVVESMLLSSSAQGNPEEIIKMKIEEYRLSL